MQMNIQKWGNSAAVRLPAAVLAQIDAKIGDAFEMDISAPTQTVSLRIAKPKPRYRLADLMAQCDLSAPAPDLAWWDEMVPVGKEVW